jgi:hypothetical protein
MIDPQGIITTVVGDGGPAISGNGGPATAATLSLSTGLAFDADGNLYFPNLYSQSISDARIRKVDKQGPITTFAGTGDVDLSGNDGPAVSAFVQYLPTIAFDSRGNLYFVDGESNRIRKVDHDRIITTVAGGGL